MRTVDAIHARIAELDAWRAGLNARLPTLNALAALVGTLEIHGPRILANTAPRAVQLTQVPPMPVNTAPRAVPLTQVPPMPVNTENTQRGRVWGQRGNRGGRLRSRSPSPIRIPGGIPTRNRSPTDNRTRSPTGRRFPAGTLFPYPVPNLNDIDETYESDEDITTT
jgi:hypothetical protein